jgi:DNA-binding GntR family transcriptional regulator
MTLVARRPVPAAAANGARNGVHAEAEPRSLAEYAYELLVRKITRLELAPGSVLVDRALMEEFGIGRTPIREALQRLAIERLVDHFPNRGMLVSEITATAVQEIYEFRAMLDGHAASLAAARATAEEVREIAAAHKKLVRASEDDDINAFVEGDRDFYRVLSAAAHNRLVADTIPRIFNLHLRLWFYISHKLGGWHALAESHQQMTREVSEAVAKRQPAKAKAAMENYVARRQQDIRKVL